MKRQLSFYALISLLLMPATGLGKDLYFSLAGSPGTVRTDARIFNPSTSKDIVVTATFLPAGKDNSTVAGKQVTVPKRQMVMLDDLLRSLFNVADPNVIGAIRLSSSDDFVATSRNYATTDRGTVGQFAPGLDPSAAKTRGVLIQLKANGAVGQPNTFGTNLGFMNPNAAAATVAILRYDKNNAVVGSAITRNIPPFSVDFPVQLVPQDGNFSDSWVGYESTQPVFGFASVMDNGTTDTTLVLGFEDTGGTAPQTKVIEMTAQTFDFSPSEIRVRRGDTVTIRVTSNDVTHGFAMENYLPVSITLTRGLTREIAFKAEMAGAFEYFCTITCGEGHTGMKGRLIVTAD